MAKKATKRPTRKAPALRRANAHHVRAWEAGEVLPSAETLRTLAQLYELSELELLLKGRYLEQVVPFIVGLFKRSRSRLRRQDSLLPLWSQLALETDRIGPLRAPGEVEGLFAIWLALRAFPPAVEIPLAENEIPRLLETRLKDRILRPTRLPRLIARAMEALHDPDVPDPVRRRRRAAEFFQDWLLHFDPHLYRICYTPTNGDEL
ncbi:MAG TPA: hypothetical protein VGI19_11045 [Candidatus Cybelea sp.]